MPAKKTPRKKTPRTPARRSPVLDRFDEILADVRVKTGSKDGTALVAATLVLAEVTCEAEPAEWPDDDDERGKE
jgi:hypothetical protein